MPNCPECKTSYQEGAVFCENCGFPLSTPGPGVSLVAGGAAQAASPWQSPSLPPELFPPVNPVAGSCSACGYVNLPGEQFCANCGVQLAPVTSTPPPLPKLVQEPAPEPGLSDPHVPQTAMPGVLPPALPSPCKVCGFVNQPGEPFCNNCGVQLIAEEPSGVTGQSPAEVPSIPAPVQPEPLLMDTTQEVLSQGLLPPLDQPLSPVDKSAPPVLPESPIEEPKVQEVSASQPQLPSVDVSSSPQPGIESSVAVPTAPAAIPKPVESPRAWECPSCGYVNPPGEDFCRVCGYWQMPAVKPVSSSSPQISEPPPMPSVDAQEVPPPQVVIQEKPVAKDLSSPQMPQSIETMPAGVASQQTIPALVIVGRLVSVSTNTTIPLLPKEQLLMGRQDPGQGVVPDIDLGNLGSASSSVSRKHARIFTDGTQVYLEDLHSTNHTYLNKLILQPGQPFPLHDGDEIRLGGLVLIYYSK